jgi:hypothetical protein
MSMNVKSVGIDGEITIKGHTETAEITGTISDGLAFHASEEYRGFASTRRRRGRHQM